MVIASLLNSLLHLPLVANRPGALQDGEIDPAEITEPLKAEPSTIILLAAGVAVLMLIAEIAHGLRIRRIGVLAFGPRARPANWTFAVPVLRAGAAGLLAWSLLTLWLDVEPKVHRAEEVEEGEEQHLVLVLDVSPSMRLKDAGPDKKQMRLHRTRDLLKSMFSRIPMGKYRVSVIATYTRALPVVIDTKDSAVLENILTDLPMHYAFKGGETRLFDGLEEAVKIADPWKPKSTTVMVLSDGDTVPPTGIPRMPPSVRGVLIVGVGDANTGSFINGRNSRQDVSSLRQMAIRLSGTYHNGNARHVATTALADVTAEGERSVLEQLTKREYALIGAVTGAALLALLPLLLHLFGTRWRAFGRPSRQHPPTHGAQNADTIRQRA